MVTVFSLIKTNLIQRKLRLPLVHRLKPVRFGSQILLITGKEIPLLQAVSSHPQSKIDTPVITSFIDPTLSSFFDHGIDILGKKCREVRRIPVAMLKVEMQQVVCIPIVFIHLGLSLPCRYIILSCPELPLTFFYPTPEFPTPNFEYHTAFDGVVFGTENPDFKGFKKKEIEPRLNDLMRQMFGGIVATEENAWAPSSGVLPSGVPMGDDTPNEGFGDSDENSNENEDIPPNEVPSNPSHETPNRRKETLGVVHGKGKKSSSSRKSSRNSLATHIEKLCESMASPRKSVNEIIFPHSEYSISNAMDALRDLEDEIPKKDELYYFAIKMFQISVKREVFLNLDPDVRVWWLRRGYAEQNPIVSFSSLVMDEFNNMYNSFYMNYDTPELSEEAQRRIATIVTQVQHNNYHEEEEQVLSSVLLHHETYFTKQPCLDSNYTGQIESNSNAAERFQRSGETVSRIFTDMLHIFARMGIDTIKPIEGQFEEVPNHIRHDTRYWPHFKDCIGAIDGTHIKACISPSCQIPYIGRKGEPTQNIMAVCDFNMCFIFAFPGWEGTAHDSRILLQALRKQQLKFPHPPPGKYYLVDSGYPQMAGFLGPYRGERYHLPDFHRGNHRATGKKEIFNHAHSSLCSVIERTFGVWKKKMANIKRYSKLFIRQASFNSYCNNGFA
ncbi:hypothetical protein PVK06_008700 [Gossypium arboreum]|uniref:DDE Tnp4 domain-containing protein n=1 Tax=Gossypium arboreum TaxID=29729 RepID=A0ABR0QLF0_GOSAR|nr:hypothetical protein PVK06_008700 [Gossypium arboreum]